MLTKYSLQPIRRLAGLNLWLGCCYVLLSKKIPKFLVLLLPYKYFLNIRRAFRKTKWSLADMGSRAKQIPRNLASFIGESCPSEESGLVGSWMGFFFYSFVNPRDPGKSLCIAPPRGRFLCKTQPKWKASRASAEEVLNVACEFIVHSPWFSFPYFSVVFTS